MHQENPPPYSAAGPPPPGMMAPPPAGPGYPPLPPPGVKQDIHYSAPYHPHPHPPNVESTTHAVIITSGPTVMLGPNPQHMICPSCHAQITSSVQTEPSTKTHLFALLLCLFGCYLCCCIPYCVDSCQSQNHNCPNCGAFLGTYQN